MPPIRSRCRPITRNAPCASKRCESHGEKTHRIRAGDRDSSRLRPPLRTGLLGLAWEHPAQRGRPGRADAAGPQYRRKGGAQLPGAAARHSPHHRRLSDRSQQQQVPVVPCARPHRGVAGADGEHHPFHGPRRPVPGVGLAAPLFLHGMPRPAECGDPARPERFCRYRYHAEPRQSRWAPMSADKPTKVRPTPWARILAFIVELWDVLRRPSSVFGLGVLVLAGFVAGVIFWGGFNTALELTNTEKFCTGCHEMRDNVFAELKSTIHFSNRSGVRASCPDCHVPHNWTDKIARKMQASKEVWGHLFGSINTRDKFIDSRLELAEHEWARFKANDSLECRNCHSSESMDITKQSPRASVAHERFLFTGEKTCIDCHKGIAHRLPDMRGVPGWQ